MEEAAKALRPAILSFQQTMNRVKQAKAAGQSAPGVVLPYKKAPVKPAARRVVAPRAAVMAAAR